MKKKLATLLCVTLLVLSFVGCTSEAPGNSAGTSQTAEDNGSDNEKALEEITVGVSFGQNVHPFFVAMQKGIEKACEDYGVKKCNILSADSSLETQNTQIENLITMGCDVILLNPYDSEGVVNAVINAENAGVGVFTMDVNCEGSTAFIASDNREIGRMLGEYVVEALNNKGKIAIVDGIVVSSLKDRTEGFKEVIEKSGLEIVAEQQTAHARDTALASAENILQANPDIDAFVGVNENSGMAILSAVTSAKLNPIITTVDATSENMSAIRDGKVAVGVSQNPYEMGYKAVEQAIAWCQGKEVEEFIEVPVEYMDQENIQEFIDREKGYGVEVE